MNEMVERVAEGMFNFYCGIHKRTTWADLVEANKNPRAWHMSLGRVVRLGDIIIQTEDQTRENAYLVLSLFRGMARAAIAAMREPTEAMLNVAKNPEAFSDAMNETAVRHLRGFYQEMIDAALKP